MDTKLRRKFIACDPSKCTDCRICQLACSAFQDKSYNPKNSRIKLFKVLSNNISYTIAVACRLCDIPLCITACPRKAITQRTDGVKEIDERKCNGCGMCTEACELGLIFIDPKNGVAVSCNLCDGDPQCIKCCPNEALDYVNVFSYMPQIKKAIKSGRM